MKINVRLYSTLAVYSPDESGKVTLDLDNAATVGRIPEMLAMGDEVQRVILVNGRHAKPETTLFKGDDVTIFPPMTGG